ncbi:MAG: prepilin-type N-terminal cleavage/methylation domain-containing protein [Endozoicomonadaceae bacterium]|nr:prepilin-type N-terminal cleavage/methylation domain-containing protein [Endozoicomonadaceae bacterium]
MRDNTIFCKGFTLLELMCVVAISAILFSWVLPIMENRRVILGLEDRAESLIGFLKMAKITAILKKTRISVCALNPNDMTCGSNSDWDNGWQLAFQSDISFVVPVKRFILKPLYSIQTTFSTNSVNAITFNPNGMNSPNVKINFCSSLNHLNAQYAKSVHVIFGDIILRQGVEVDCS